MHRETSPYTKIYVGGNIETALPLDSWMTTPFGHMNPRFYSTMRNLFSVLIVSIFVLTETFQCPICYEEGKNALTLCNNGITYEICNKEEPMCKITKKLLFGRVWVSRSCSDKETYDYLTGKLSTSTKNGFCTESRCMAGLPGNQ